MAIRVFALPAWVAHGDAKQAGFWRFGEPLSLSRVLGIGLMIAGVALLSR